MVISRKTFLSDLLAGLTVSFAALSLGAAFGVMSGRGAISGMMGAAIIPIITSIFGGTRIQASGPTAPMTAITALVVALAHDKYALDNVMAEQFISLTLILSGLLIILAGIVRLGRFIQLVPQVVVIGFMNGIAVLIWVDQIKKLFGLGKVKPIEGDFGVNLLLAFTSLLLIYLIPFTLKKLNVPENIRRFLPSILLVIILFTVFTTTTHLNVEHVQLGQSFSSFSDFTNQLMLYLPTSSELYTLSSLATILPFSLQLCMLAYLDSLLTSLVIDKMTNEHTNSNKELIAQGLGNGFSALFQGIPGAQATIRSVLLLKEGAQSRLAGVLVGVFTLIGFMVFNAWITLIASAVFTGILLKAGLDVLERDFPIAYFKRHWFADKQRNVQLLLVVYTTLVTVLIDLNVAVFTGTILFYLGKKYLSWVDVEDNFAEVHSDELLGVDTMERLELSRPA